MKLQNDLILRAAKGEQVERIPVWMMRQAGRILPEYRKVREKAGSFITLATTPEMAAEVTIQPVDILGVDAAIIFSIKAILFQTARIIRWCISFLIPSPFQITK